MNKQEFIDKYGEYFDSRFIADLTLVIIDEKKKVIAEHEASQWKKYPENQPCDKSLYYVHTVDDREFDALGCQFDKLEVIAFRALPSSYQPTVTDNEAKNKSCRGCKYNVDTVLCSHPTPCRTDWENYNAG